VTPDAWQTCPDPETLLQHLAAEKLLKQRKARLFAVACCRRIWHLLEDEGSRRAVQAAERLADGGASRHELDAACAAASIAQSIAFSLPTDDSNRQAHCARYCACISATFAALPDGRDASNHHYAATAKMWERTDDPEAELKERSAQADLVRCLFPPPPDHRVLIPQGVLVWNHGTAVRLAKRVYDDRDFSPATLFVLADALEEGGCTDAWALQHLRGAGPHARGCAVVDAVLRKK
jgi:hypothetical protein